MFTSTSQGLDRNKSEHNDYFQKFSCRHFYSSEMGFLLVFILQYQTAHVYSVSNHLLLIYNWIPKFILHLVHSSNLMLPDIDAVHHQIVTNSTVVHSIE